MNEKEYRSYRQLLTILRSRGMMIDKGSQGSRVMRILEKENYYNIINGYKELFLASHSTDTTDEVYKAGTAFDEVYALYTFDREIRNIYLTYLLKIENMLKTVISHEFSALYGHDNYLKISSFQATNEKEVASVTKLIGDIQQEIARQMSKHHQVVTHYMTQHGYIPLWVLVNVLTFGKITNFYLNMKPKDRMEVGRKFSVPYEELHKYMTMLGLARNKCAHDERFFDIRFRNSLAPRQIRNWNVLNISKNSNPSGTKDAYAIAIIFALLLQKADTKLFVASIKNAFQKLSKSLTTISVDDVMKIMGYPSNWTDLLNLK